MLIIRNIQGFSLLELMIVVAIIGLLSTIAYPSYKSYVLRSNRSDALAALERDQVSLERCYAQNYSYNAACTGLPTFPHNSPQNYYSIAISNLGVSTYTLTATPIGNQTQDTTCASITLDQANQKNGTDTSGNAQTSCWVL